MNYAARHLATRHHARGFTLIEVTLAVVLSAMVLAGCLSVFLAMRNVEKTFSARFERTSELDITHTSFVRALLSLQMKEAETTTVVRAGSTQQAEEEAASDRGRLILEYDTSVEPDSTGWIPQRLEVVCSTPPVPAGLASRAAGWYTAEAREESLDFSALDGSQGITRGVFELRPSGQRERIMQRLGLITATDPLLAESELEMNQAPDPYARPDWTLWWRPILTNEAEQLAAGFGPYPDAYGEPEEIRERLAGAVPLLRHIDRCIWELYKGDEFIDQHLGLEMTDLPAYAQFELILTNQQYASWMFEIDWIIGDDPLDVATATASANADAQGDGTDDAQPDNNNGAGGGGGGGNGGVRGGNRTQLDINGES
jgi:prepilin-type N-terminal cleavage/methylation domain-containing protein